MMFRAMTAVFVAGVLAAPVLAQDELLIDYNNPGALDIADPKQWSAVAEKIGGDIEVLGEVTGSFTAGGVDQVAYLVSKGAPVAAEPFPELDQRLTTP